MHEALLGATMERGGAYRASLDFNKIVAQRPLTINTTIIRDKLHLSLEIADRDRKRHDESVQPIPKLPVICQKSR